MSRKSFLVAASLALGVGLLGLIAYHFSPIVAVIDVKDIHDTSVAIRNKTGAAVISQFAGDTTDPTVNSFDVQARIINPGASVTASFTVADTGGSHLKSVGLNRALFNASNCNATNKSGCSWSTPKTVTAPSAVDAWTSTLVDSPPIGVWWYGLEVKDNAGHNGYEPVTIQVTVRSVAITPSPTPTSLDTISPRVVSFDVQPRTLTAGTVVSVPFTVTDSGGSHLVRIGLNRAPYNASLCSVTNRSGCQWTVIIRVNAPVNADSWTSAVSDTPPVGTWWYGFSVTDGAGRAGYEPALIPVTVSAATPVPTASATATPPPTPTAATNPGAFGMSVGASLLGVSQTELNARLDDMVSLGLTWLRFDIDWTYVQPQNATTYNWTDVDRVIAAANVRHIKILAILDDAPLWARIAGCSSAWCPPANSAAFALFASAAVQRYAPLGVHSWEVWNEPNLWSFWQTGANVVAYTNLLQAAYAAIKSQDPSATVVTGSMGPAATAGGDIAPIDFLAGLYANGAKNSFDAVGYHPYSYPARPTYTAPWNGWSQMYLTAPSLRSVMTANGDSAKQIWLTEFGAPTGGPGAVSTAADYNFSANPDHVTEELQTLIMQDAILTMAGQTWDGPLFFYTYKDSGTSPTTNENFFGVIRFDGTQKPSYQAIKVLMAP